MVTDWASPSGSSFSSDAAPEAAGLGDGVTREEIETVSQNETQKSSRCFFKVILARLVHLFRLSVSGISMATVTLRVLSFSLQLKRESISTLTEAFLKKLAELEEVSKP